MSENKNKIVKFFGAITGFFAMHLVCCGGLLFSGTLLGVGTGTALLSTNIWAFAVGAILLATGAAFWHHSKCKKQCGCPVEARKKTKLALKKTGLKIAAYVLSGVIVSFAVSEFLNHDHTAHHDHIVTEQVQSQEK